MLRFLDFFNQKITKTNFLPNETLQAEQTETGITEILKNEQALHISKESTPSIMDLKVENVKETSEGTEEDDDAKNDNKDEQEIAENNDTVENSENGDRVAKNSNNEQGKTTDEIRCEEVSSEVSVTLEIKYMSFC